MQTSYDFAIDKPQAEKYFFGAKSVLRNLEKLKQFKVGDLPIIDWNTKTVGIDHRYTLTRNATSWFSTAFDPQFVEKIFHVALLIIKDHDMFLIEKEVSEKIKAYLKPALEGVKKIQKTYETNTGWIFSGKRQDFARTLENIIKFYNQRFEEQLNLENAVQNGL